MKHQFRRDTLTVDEFMKSHEESENPELELVEIQKYLLSNLRDMTQLGMYSTL